MTTDGVVFDLVDAILDCFMFGETEPAVDALQRYRTKVLGVLSTFPKDQQSAALVCCRLDLLERLKWIKRGEPEKSTFPSLVIPEYLDQQPEPLPPLDEIPPAPEPGT